ncbi:RCC1 domain-containing protein [Polyangium spumosum]|uniref:RCC1-like domain-containing protein n=1 Tax=Polyangium spumosum TaxID=889282 RepID=A0A6N7PEC9_9BACT|nr:hypothetical protein [Polyangium spumosum]MRG90413.1 hypothetical protein [Polyangium spumosum]
MMNGNLARVIATSSLLLGLAACGARSTLADLDGSSGAGGSAAASSGSVSASSGAGGDAPPPVGPLEPAQLALGHNHGCALFGNGTVKCWGKNDRGQLGLEDTLDRGAAPGTMGAALPTVDLGQGRTAVAIAAGSHSTCAILDTDELKCWGANFQGKLGQGDTTNRGDKSGTMGDALAVVDLGAGARVGAVAVGNYHACALLQDGSVRCWGDATASGVSASHGAEPGTMGDALPAVRLGAGKTAREIAAGFNTSCALLDDQSTKCWGVNSSGNLGLGDLEPRGDSPETMGDALPAIDFGAPRVVIQMAPSSSSSCALLDDASVRCWGNGVDLGLGGEENRGDKPGTMGVNLPAVDLGPGRAALSLSAGARRACALLEDRQIKCWGYNPEGQLGQGDTNNRGDEPGEMGDALATVDLGTGRSALAVEAGGFFTCAILDTREVKCWGLNTSGELGLGDTSARGAEPGTMGDNLPVVVLW